MVGSKKYVHLNNCAVLCSTQYFCVSIPVGNQRIFLNKFKIFMKKSRFSVKIVSVIYLMKLFDDYYNIKANMA